MKPMNVSRAIDYAISALLDMAKQFDDSGDLEKRGGCINAAHMLLHMHDVVIVPDEMPARGEPCPSDEKGPKQAWRPQRGHWTFCRDGNDVKHIDTGRVVASCINSEWAGYTRDALEKQAESIGSFPEP